MTSPGSCTACGGELPANGQTAVCPHCGLGGHEAAHTMAHLPPPSDAAPARLAPHLPQLEIGELVARGGMGEVYRARQVKLDRVVALKVLPPDTGGPAFAARFAREARTLARLSHRHIVGVHDFGEAGGLYYFLMEYVEGGSLRRRMRDGPLGPAEALQVARQVCDALEYAHDEGVAHRDIKPENLLLDRRGRVKVADFGLAKLLGNEAESNLTGSHQVMGTLKYMAPEQLERPRDVDHRADLYSLGVVLYEMLTGEVPVGRFEPPSARGVADRRIDEVVLRALERDPARRYQHARDLRDALDSLVSRAGAPPQETRPYPAPAASRGLLRNPLAWAFLLCLVGVAVCFEPLSLWGEPQVVGPRGDATPVGSVYGFNSAAGLVPGVVFLVLWFGLLASGVGRPRGWQAAALIVVGLVSVLVTGSLILSTDTTAVGRFETGMEKSDKPAAPVLTTTGTGIVNVLGVTTRVGLRVTATPGGGCKGTYRAGGRLILVQGGEPDGSSGNGLSVENPLGPVQGKVYAWPYVVVGLGLALVSLGCLQVRVGTP